VAEEAWDEVNTSTMYFHRAVVQMLDSARTDAFFENILAQLRLCFGFVPDRGEFHVKWLERDEHIASLVVAGRRDEAAKEMAFYLDDSEAQIIDLIRSGREVH
jgi:DNA-binding GntR family transcriptional regulator